MQNTQIYVKKRTIFLIIKRGSQYFDIKYIYFKCNEYYLWAHMTNKTHF